VLIVRSVFQVGTVDANLKIRVVHLSHEHDEGLDHGQAKVGKEWIADHLSHVVGRCHVIRSSAVVDAATPLVLKDQQELALLFLKGWQFVH